MRKLRFLHDHEARLSVSTLVRIEEEDRSRKREWDRVWELAAAGIGPHPFVVTEMRIRPTKQLLQEVPRVALASFGKKGGS